MNELVTLSPSEVTDFFGSKTGATNINADDHVRQRRQSIENRRLLIAAGEGKVEEVERLWHGETDRNFTDKDGNSAICYAIENSQAEIVRFLLSKGAKFAFVNYNNVTPLEMALASLNREKFRAGSDIIDMLMERLRVSLVAKTTDMYQFDSDQSNAWSSEKSLNSTNDSEPYCQGKEIKEVEKRDKEIRKEVEKREILISSLRKRLNNINQERFTYQHANTYILFLEVFALQNMDSSLKPFVREKLGITADLHTTIENTRSLLLKCRENSENAVTLDLLKNIISHCHNVRVGNINDFFYTNLKNFVLRPADAVFSMKVCTDPTLRSFKIKSDSAENKYETLKDLVIQAYRPNKSTEELWFQFIVRIYPTLGFKEGCVVGEIGRKIRDLRNKLIHAFDTFSTLDFRGNLINLRGSLFEYYFAKRIASVIRTLLDGENVFKSTKGFQGILKEIQSQFAEADRLSLSAEEVKDLFGYRVVRSLFPRVSEEYRNTSLKELVTEYFMCMCLVEDVDRDDGEKRLLVEGFKYNENKKLTNVTRRKLFETFFRLKRLKKECYKWDEAVYRKEMNELRVELASFGVLRFKFEAVCKSYMDAESYVALNEACKNFIANLVEFILIIRKICSSSENDIVLVGKLLLNANSSQKQLLLNQNIRIRELKENTKTKNETLMAIDMVANFGEVLVEYGTVNIKVDGKSLVQNVLETLYNAYDEYKIEFDDIKIFYREGFLKELLLMTEQYLSAMVPKSNDTYQRVSFSLIAVRLIEVDYLSPFVVILLERLIEGKSGPLIQLKEVENLAAHLLNSTERVKYFHSLLNLKFPEEFNLYDILCEKIFEKHLDFQIVSFLFTCANHLVNFVKVLRKKVVSVSDEGRRLHFITSFMKVICEEAARRIHSSSANRKALQEASDILDQGYGLLEKCGDINSFEKDAVVLSILRVRLQNKKKQYGNSMTTIANMQERQINASSVLDDLASQFLLLSEKAYTLSLEKAYNGSAETYGKLYQDVMNYLLKKSKNDTSVNARDGIRERYSQIKDLASYRELLDSSTVLQSHIYLRVEGIALQLAKQIRYKNLSSFNIREMLDALKIVTDVYWCIKSQGKRTDLVLSHLTSHIGLLYEQIGRNLKPYESLFFYHLNMERIYIILDDWDNNFGTMADLKHHISSATTTAYHIGLAFTKLKRFELAENILEYASQMNCLLHTEKPLRYYNSQKARAECLIKLAKASCEIDLQLNFIEQAEQIFQDITKITPNRQLDSIRYQLNECEILRNKILNMPAKRTHQPSYFTAAHSQI